MKAIYQAPILERLKDIERCVKLAIEYYEQDSPTVALDFRLREKEHLEDDEIALFDWVIRPRFPDPPQDGKFKLFGECTEVEQLRIQLSQSELCLEAMRYAAQAENKDATRLFILAHEFAIALDSAGMSKQFRVGCQCPFEIGDKP